MIAHNSAILLFLLALFYDLQAPDDDGSCVQNITQSACWESSSNRASSTQQQQQGTTPITVKLDEEICELPSEVTRAHDDVRQSFQQISSLVLNDVRNIEEATHDKDNNKIIINHNNEKVKFNKIFLFNNAS